MPRNSRGGKIPKSVPGISGARKSAFFGKSRFRAYLYITCTTIWPISGILENPENPGRAKKCTFLRVFNNSPSRDRFLGREKSGFFGPPRTPPARVAAPEGGSQGPGASPPGVPPSRPPPGQGHRAAGHRPRMPSPRSRQGHRGSRRLAGTAPPPYATDSPGVGGDHDPTGGTVTPPGLVDGTMKRGPCGAESRGDRQARPGLAHRCW